MLAMMAANKYYKYFSLRHGTTIACLMVFVGCLIFSLSNSSIVCYAAAACMGFSYGMGGMIPIAIIMKSWFKSKLATATAICTLGSSIATVLAPPIITKLTDLFGLKFTFRMEAVFIIICSVIIFCIIRDRPEEKGLLSYENEDSGKIEKRIVKETVVDRNINHAEWLIIVAASFIVGFAGTPATANLSIHYVTAGYTQMQAAAALSIFGLVMIIAKFSFGTACDRFGTYRMNYVFASGYVLANVVLVFVNGSSLLLMIFSVLLMGMGSAIGALGVTYWTGDFSKPELYAKNIQRNQTMFSMGSLIMTPFPGIIADRTGSYAPAYALFGILLFIMTVGIQWLYYHHSKVRVGA